MIHITLRSPPLDVRITIIVFYLNISLLFHIFIISYAHLIKNSSKSWVYFFHSTEDLSNPFVNFGMRSKGHKKECYEILWNFWGLQALYRSRLLLYQFLFCRKVRSFIIMSRTRSSGLRKCCSASAAFWWVSGDSKSVYLDCLPAEAQGLRGRILGV